MRLPNKTNSSTVHRPLSPEKNIPRPCRPLTVVRRRFDSKGFTLTEVLIAVVILATGLLLIIEGMGRSQQALRVGENLISASREAEERLSEYEIEVRERNRLSTGTEEGTSRYLGKEFKWEKECAAFHDSSLADETKLNFVHVQISWKEGSRDNRFALDSLILNREGKA